MRSFFQIIEGLIGLAGLVAGFLLIMTTDINLWYTVPPTVASGILIVDVLFSMACHRWLHHPHDVV